MIVPGSARSRNDASIHIPTSDPCAVPSFAFPERVAFGAALRGGCAAAHLHQQLPDTFLSFQQDDDIRNVPVTLPTIRSVSPIHFLILGASLRDRATLPSPLRGLGPSGGYPSRLRSLRSLRGPLARRLAALTAVSSARRRPHSRTPPCSRRSASRALTRHGGFPPVPFPEPISLSFGTLGLVLWTPGGGLALTPHAAGCRAVTNPLPVRPSYRPLPARRQEPTSTDRSLLGRVCAHCHCPYPVEKLEFREESMTMRTRLPQLDSPVYAHRHLPQSAQRSLNATHFGPTV